MNGYLPTLPESGGLQWLVEYARSLSAIRVAVVHPCDALSLSSMLDSQSIGLIDPVIVGPKNRLESIASDAGLDLKGLVIHDLPHSHAAAEYAIELARKGEVEALMKGSLHTDELMSAALDHSAGLRTDRRVSHCFLMHTPAYPRPFIITDAAINIAPTLSEKADIIRNAVDLANSIGISKPKVAVLAAIETINPAMQSTLDAAALCKMVDRGQMTGCLLDGPLGFDNAVSIEAAHIKGIVSEVAGQADVLVVPNLESGNMLVKLLQYMGNASSAGIVLGMKVPIMLNSRADSVTARIYSCALAHIFVHYRRTGLQARPPPVS